MVLLRALQKALPDKPDPDYWLITRPAVAGWSLLWLFIATSNKRPG